MSMPSHPPQPIVPAPDWPVLDGYEIDKVLGRGGMGVVYRARDRRRGVVVAVKTIQRADAGAIYRFKQEFRALLDVSHPNLVTLHELISDGHAWFIVMEFIDGVNFLDYVRGEPMPGGSPEPRTLGRGDDPEQDDPDRTIVSPRSAPGWSATPTAALEPEGWARLRRALRQLAEGLAALHRAGKLHRDIKPTNVMVTRQGRVVVMDFGLIASPASDAGEASHEGELIGTVPYMSPEQAAGRALSPASDWYSVGVMIFEALTGRRPFQGHLFKILVDKQEREPPPPRELAPDIPDDLDALCVDLLRRDPHARPSGREVLGRLGAEDHTTGPADGPPHSPAAGLPFVGREAHRAALDDAVAALARGRTVALFVQGRSGVGKSALVQTFLDGLVDRDEAVVLSGRCYERESVPYKALDSLIDALSRYLRRLPPSEAEALMPRDVGPLARVFPVLRRVEAVAAAPRRTAEVPDPQELRRRAYAALRELLARLGDRRPLVLAIDDLQWGDADSLAVLAEIIRSPRPPTLLLLACYRSEGADSNPFLLAALDTIQGEDLDRRVLAVGPLSPSESRALARHLLGTDGPEAEKQAEVIAQESGGNPLFVAELVQAVRTAVPDADPNSGVHAPISLDDVLWARILGLPEVARRLLEIVAVSGGPLRPEVAWQCLGRDDDERSTVAMLRSSRLIRGAGGSSGGERVEAYHDRVRETVVAHLSPSELRDDHRRLALALEGSGEGDHEMLGVHFRGAGEPARAGAHFALAAGQAAEALAFERASGLYRLALKLHPPPPAEARRLRAALAEALANAGRGAEAAREYLAACEGATVAEALELRRRATMQFLISGHIDQGLESLRDVLAAIGMALPRTPNRALASLLWRRALLRLRGMGFRPREASEIAAEDLTRIDVCWSAGIGLSNVDWIRGADFQARGLLLALRAGEPYRVARALAVEAAQVATGGTAARRRTARLLDKAASLARASGQPYAEGMVTLAEGVSSYLEGRWADSLSACDRAEAVFRDSCTGVAWELDTAHAYALWALSHLGRWAELARRFPALITEARERGDLYAAMNLSTYIQSIVRLAADEPELAREETGRMLGRWSRQGYHVQHNDQVWASVQIDLYLGDGAAAWERIIGHWPTLSASLLMRVQFIRVAMLGLRARCALAAATGEGPHARAAGRDAARLEREGLPWADAQASLVRAGLASLHGRRAEAVAHLEQAAVRFRSCDMELCAAVADRRLGETLGGPDGRPLVERADGWMAAQGVRRPDRLANLFAPGFRRE
jgi:eukaryotic-like serine/threonine-protein kinase